MMTSSARMDGDPWLPVILMDGDESVHVGNISLHESQSFKDLQFAISRQIGVDPYQICSFLVRDQRFRILIDEKIDLRVVSREIGHWHVLSVLRRPKNRQNGKNRRMRGHARFATEYLDLNPQDIVLRRRSNDCIMRQPEIHVNNVTSLWDQYYRAQTLNSLQFWGKDTWREGRASRSVCGVCDRIGDGEKGFHRCVKDEVVMFFRSNVGPIQRPSRRLEIAN